MSQTSLFIHKDDRFIPTDNARSPWGRDMLHGGPVAALLARQIEQQRSDAALHVTRLTVDLLRPVPKAPLQVKGRIVRTGRRIEVSEASLLVDGVEVSRAVGLLFRPRDSAEIADTASMDTPIRHIPPPTDGIPGFLGGGKPSTEDVGYHTTVEIRRVESPDGDVRPLWWARLPIPLLPGETLTPTVRAAAIADFTNAIANYVPGSRTGFINADTTMYLQRPPVGEWLCLALNDRQSTDGIAVATTSMYDETGLVGHCTVASLINPRPPGLV